ncbi:hypothetical protein [Acidithiobacillus sp.]|nr:hypothetical protein [Acidithiobacillus sp.]
MKKAGIAACTLMSRSYILVAAGLKKTAEVVPLKKLPGHRKSAI